MGRSGVEEVNSVRDLVVDDAVVEEGPGARDDEAEDVCGHVHDAEVCVREEGLDVVVEPVHYAFGFGGEGEG